MTSICVRKFVVCVSDGNRECKLNELRNFEKYVCSLPITLKLKSPNNTTSCFLLLSTTLFNISLNPTSKIKLGTPGDLYPLMTVKLKIVKETFEQRTLLLLFLSDVYLKFVWFCEFFQTVIRR